MKKLGFTLSELLVAVGIVAVVSLVVAPTVTDIIPDKNKIKVINYYNKINEVNQKLLSNKDLFRTQYYYDKVSERMLIEYSGFADVQLNQEYWNELSNIIEWTGDYPIGQNNKYPQFFIYTLTGKVKDNDDYNACKLEDGVRIKITNDFWNTNVIPNTIRFSFKLDLDGKEKGANCSYGENGCKKPDTFIFKVDENGNVTAGDAMTDAYLSNVSKTNNKKEDKELAKKYLSEKSY